MLDEQLIAARKAAALVAYQWVTLTTVVVLVLVITFVGDAAERRHLEALFLGFTLAAVFAPKAVRARREPEV